MWKELSRFKIPGLPILRHKEQKFNRARQTREIQAGTGCKFTMRKQEQPMCAGKTPISPAADSSKRSSSNNAEPSRMTLSLATS